MRKVLRVVVMFGSVCVAGSVCSKAVPQRVAIFPGLPAAAIVAPGRVGEGTVRSNMPKLGSIILMEMGLGIIVLLARRRKVTPGLLRS